MESVRQNLEREAEGLRARYAAAQTDAAFSLDTLENDEGSRGAEKRLVILEESVVYCEQRIRQLNAQSVALGELADAARAKFAPFRQKEDS